MGLAAGGSDVAETGRARDGPDEVDAARCTGTGTRTARLGCDTDGLGLRGPSAVRCTAAGIGRAVARVSGISAAVGDEPPVSGSATRPGAGADTSTGTGRSPRSATVDGDASGSCGAEGAESIPDSRGDGTTAAEGQGSGGVTPSSRWATRCGGTGGSGRAGTGRARTSGSEPAGCAKAADWPRAARATTGSRRSGAAGPVARPVAGPGAGPVTGRGPVDGVGAWWGEVAVRCTGGSGVALPEGGSAGSTARSNCGSGARPAVSRPSVGATSAVSEMSGSEASGSGAAGGDDSGAAGSDTDRPEVPGSGAGVRCTAGAAAGGVGIDEGRDGGGDGKAGEGPGGAVGSALARLGRRGSGAGETSRCRVAGEVGATGAVGRVIVGRAARVANVGAGGSDSQVCPGGASRARPSTEPAGASGATSWPRRWRNRGSWWVLRPAPNVSRWQADGGP